MTFIVVNPFQRVLHEIRVVPFLFERLNYRKIVLQHICSSVIMK